jgi:hypothetical protein
LWLVDHPDACRAMTREAHDVIGEYTWPAVRDAWFDVYARAPMASAAQGWSRTA